MFGLSRLYIGLIGAGLIASFVFYQGVRLGKYTRQPEITRLTENNLALKNTLAEINLRMSEQNEELTQARQADEDIKPVAGSKSDDRLRVLSNDPACRNCK